MRPEAARRRPRPVAGAPVSDLADGRAVAKAWLVALLDDAPLERASGVPVAALADEGPALCAALVAAIGSDEALDALESAARGTGRLAGAGSPAALVGALESLRRATLDELRERVAAADEGLLAALADRVAHLCSIVARAALDGGSSGGIERRLAAARPFALLAVEVDDLDRLTAAAGTDAHAALASAEAALAAVLGSGDELLRERPGRCWITTATVDDAAVRELAGRVSQAATEASSAAGLPLRVSIGVAIHPADGTTADALVVRADEGLFAARAAGLPIA